MTSAVFLFRQPGREFPAPGNSRRQKGLLLQGINFFLSEYSDVVEVKYLLVHGKARLLDQIQKL